MNGQYHGRDRRLEASRLLSEEQLEYLARNAAEQAAKQVFAILGVDIEEPKDVEEFRKDLRFGQQMRKTADHGILVFWGLVVTGMVAALFAGIMSSFGIGKH